VRVVLALNISVALAISSQSRWAELSSGMVAAAHSYAELQLRREQVARPKVWQSPKLTNNSPKLRPSLALYKNAAVVFRDIH
jgi:hypothetical protein